MQRPKFPMSRASYRPQRDSNIKQRPNRNSSDGSDVSDGDSGEERLYPELKNISNDYLESSWNRSKSDPNLSNSDSPERSFKNRRPSDVGTANDFNRERTHRNLKGRFMPKKQTSSWEFSFSWVLIVIGIIPVICFYFGGWGDNEHSFFEKLREKYQNQPAETLDIYKAIMSDCLENDPSYPVVFLFLYTEQNKIINNLVKDLAEYSSKQMKNNEKYIEVSKEEFRSSEALNDYGHLINKYREQLFTKQVMVIKDLQEIPGQVAPVFHTLCDEVSPLVNRAVVYMFTIKVESLEGQAEIIATNKLKASWYDLKNDVIIPLLARITGVVIKVIEE